METTQYGFGDPATWQKCTGHPNDPRTDTASIEARLYRQIAINKACIQSRLGKDDETDLAIADRLIRYLVDSDIVHILRLVLKNNQDAVFLAIQKLIGNAIDSHAESLACKQLNIEE